MARLRGPACVGRGAYGHRQESVGADRRADLVGRRPRASGDRLDTHQPAPVAAGQELAQLADGITGLQLRQVGEGGDTFLAAQGEAGGAHDVVGARAPERRVHPPEDADEVVHSQIGLATVERGSGTVGGLCCPR